MYFGLSEDQIFFQENVSKFLADHASLDVIKKIADDDNNEMQTDIERGLINLGLNSLVVPENYGGLGLDLLFAAAIAQSLGEGIAQFHMLDHISWLQLQFLKVVVKHKNKNTCPKL